MIKPYHLLIAILIGFGAGCFIVSCGDNREALEDPQIHRLKEEITWRQFNEKKDKDSIGILKKEKIALSKDVIKERIRADQSEAKLKEHRANVPVLLTTKDTIGYLKQDTTLCDQALADSKKLAAGLTLEIVTDNAIIKGQGELIDSLQADKKDLTKVDSLNQIEKKKLRKSNRKNFFKGLGVGGVIGVILSLLL